MNLIKVINPIVDFYLDGKTLRKDLGFTFEDFLRFNDEQLEQCHAYIQWVFPLREVSQFNPDAPLVNNATLEYFDEFVIFRDKMYDAYRKMTNFYFNNGKGWDRWVTKNNHNFLRITRIIKSLRLFGFYNQAHDFYAYCQSVMKNDYYNQVIGEVTKTYWRDAIGGIDINESMG